MSVCLSFPIKLPIKPELQRTPEPNKLGLPQNIIITKKNDFDFVWTSWIKKIFLYLDNTIYRIALHAYIFQQNIKKNSFFSVKEVKRTTAIYLRAKQF